MPMFGRTDFLLEIIFFLLVSGSFFTLASDTKNGMELDPDPDFEYVFLGEATEFADGRPFKEIHENHNMVKQIVLELIAFINGKEQKNNKGQSIIAPVEKKPASISYALAVKMSSPVKSVPEKISGLKDSVSEGSLVCPPLNIRRGKRSVETKNESQSMNTSCQVAPVRGISKSQHKISNRKTGYDSERSQNNLRKRNREVDEDVVKLWRAEEERLTAKKSQEKQTENSRCCDKNHSVISDIDLEISPARKSIKITKAKKKKNNDVMDRKTQEKIEEAIFAEAMEYNKRIIGVDSVQKHVGLNQDSWSEMKMCSDSGNKKEDLKKQSENKRLKKMTSSRSKKTKSQKNSERSIPDDSKKSRDDLISNTVLAAVERKINELDSQLLKTKKDEQTTDPLMEKKKKKHKKEKNNGGMSQSLKITQDGQLRSKKLQPYQTDGENTEDWMFIDNVLKMDEIDHFWDYLRPVYEKADPSRVLSQELTLLMLKAARYNQEALNIVSENIFGHRIDLGGDELLYLIFLYRQHAIKGKNIEPDANIDSIVMPNWQLDKLEVNSDERVKDVSAIGEITHQFSHILDQLYIVYSDRESIDQELKTLSLLIDHQQALPVDRSEQLRSKLAIIKDLVGFEFGDKVVGATDPSALQAWLYSMVNGPDQDNLTQYERWLGSAKMTVPCMGILKSIFDMSYKKKTLEQSRDDICFTFDRQGILSGKTREDLLQVSDNPVCCVIPQAIFFQLLLYREMLEEKMLRALIGIMAQDEVLFLLGRVFVIRKCCLKENLPCIVCSGLWKLQQLECGTRICTSCCANKDNLLMMNCFFDCDKAISDHQKTYPDNFTNREIRTFYQQYPWVSWKPVR
ncbi:hypothetical protein CI610_02024 [invertebrate metagenome]|uniref:Uncharacterized protein n=1 Tax=invertebrate metagenome TaxID=1711999 RepID=A0A2H9T706_9ZZZZ